MKKWGVFLVVFALIFVALIFVSGTFATKKYNLSGKLGISGNVVDYGIYEDEEKLIDKFVDIYIENLKNGEKTYLVTGNEKEIKISSYEDISQGEINIVTEEKRQKVEIKEGKYSLTKIIPKSNKVEIIINGKTYKFEIKENENVYLIIKEKTK